MQAHFILGKNVIHHPPLDSCFHWRLPEGACLGQYAPSGSHQWKHESAGGCCITFLPRIRSPWWYIFGKLTKFWLYKVPCYEIFYVAYSVYRLIFEIPEMTFAPCTYFTWGFFKKRKALINRAVSDIGKGFGLCEKESHFFSNSGFPKERLRDSPFQFYRLPKNLK